MSLDGEPCWIQLTTDDVDMAISFYGDLFGWSAGEPSEEHQGYRMFFRGDQPVAGLVPTPDGISPSWSVFLATTDLAATLERATAAGGRVLIETWPVGDLGSFAELVDPAGAAIGAWQADTFAGFAVRNQDNAPAWFETLSTRYDETVARAVSVGGELVRAAEDTPYGRMATLTDLGGVQFCVMRANW
jgi:predicted enzyme related to lactoylglutathione lyase